ncbi:MAG: hypothetical protein J1F01_10320 [Oscillospiraceae bacterium]|nr:hypothetical protein [Oscillospiraceae bacterium]
MDNHLPEGFHIATRPCQGDNVPSSLFHYTNLDILALILKNRTIRLTRLDFLDDLEEKKYRSLASIKVHTYVSCWTKDERESIPMWNMYTDMASGIRIEMPTLPFHNMDTIGGAFFLLSGFTGSVQFVVFFLCIISTYS